MSRGDHAWATAHWPDYLPGVWRGSIRPSPPAPKEARQAMEGSEKEHAVVPVDHARQLPRLRRIEGQVRGVQQMIGSGRHCVDVAHQIDAVVAALRRVRSDMVRDHMHAVIGASVAGDLPEAERRRLADEAADLIARIV